MPTVLEDGRSGITSTDPEHLIEGAAELLRDPALASRLGEAGRAIARERFGIDRFVRDWDRAFADVTGRSDGRGSGPSDRRARPVAVTA
jgi:glycosyltransferase involved in cell wall biosynthesis